MSNELFKNSALSIDDIPSHLLDDDNRLKCWNDFETSFGIRCGMCPACYGMIFDWQLESHEPPKKERFCLWGWR
jgi:hypothetical protein